VLGLQSRHSSGWWETLACVLLITEKITDSAFQVQPLLEVHFVTFLAITFHWTGSTIAASFWIQVAQCSDGHLQYFKGLTPNVNLLKVNNTMHHQEG
jgi:hypothetical protein